jgi:transposase
MSQNQDGIIAVVGIDIGKNSFHVVGSDKRGSIVLRQKWSRGQIEARLANLPPCLVGWRPALGRIISPVSSPRSDTTRG